MNIETELCKRLKDLFKGLLPTVEIVGNWLSEDAGKGLEPYAGERLDIAVSGHRHEGYQSPIVETTVNLDLDLDLDADVTLDATIAAHEKIAARLEEWHGDLASVKRDLAVDGIYMPVGLKVDDSGTLALDRDTKTRTLTHQFTIKGRIIK